MGIWDSEVLLTMVLSTSTQLSTDFYVPHVSHLSAVGKSAFPDVLSEAAWSWVHASTHVQAHSGCALCSFLHFLCMSFEMYIIMYMHVHTFWCAVHLSPHLHIHSHIHSHTHTHSLGISMLEVSCDLELPSGGQNWHLLRQGRMPEDFTKGSCCPPGLLMGQCFDQLENHIDQKDCYKFLEIARAVHVLVIVFLKKTTAL